MTDRNPAPQPQQARVRYPKYTKLFCFINAVVCLGTMGIVGLKLVFGERASGFINSENRNLAEFPSFSLKSSFSGDYTAGIVNYYTDTIASREQLRAAANRFTDLFGIHGKGSVEIYGNAVQGGQERLTEEDKLQEQHNVTVYTGTQATTTTTSGAGTTVQTEATETEPIQTKQRTETGNDGAIVNGSVIVSGKGTPNVRAMSVFGGVFERGKRYAGVLNDYKTMVGNTVNVYNLSAPLAAAYYMPENLKSQFSDEHECIKNIGTALNGVINVDVFDAIGAHTDEYIYFRTDHHWQPLGAYYAAQKFAECAQVPFADLSTYEKCQKEGFVGTMYGYTNYLADLQKYPDTFYYYKPQNQYTIRYYDDTFQNPQDGKLFYEFASGVNTYSTILGGDVNIAEIKTDVGNGRTVVVIKNSYGNALVPFLVGSFEKIYVVDFRHVRIGMQDLFRRTGATDVLFCMAISSCYTDSHINAIKEIMQ